MLTLLFTDMACLDEAFLDRCPAGQQPQAASLPRRRERTASQLLLLHALALWQSGTRSLPLQQVSFPLLASHAGKPLPILRYGAHGKPALATYPHLFFNVSHCRQAVALVLHTIEVGIDIECRRKVSPALLRKVCSEEEQRQIACSPDPTLAFLRLWTCKESMVKQSGTGLTASLPNLLTSLSPTLCQRTLWLPSIEGWLTVTTEEPQER